MQTPITAYRGRFAPSPSGPLHAGSLVAALASFLDARVHQGQWLLRIENIDPPREMPGAADIILKQLEQHGLHWDQSPFYQSDSAPLFTQVLDDLLVQQKAYYCNCTRKEIQARGGHYDGHCRHLQKPAKDSSVRFKNDSAVAEFTDRILGTVRVPHEFTHEDFVLKRRDKLWAYQMAVVIDDYQQGINHVVRGQDLLFPTVWQLALWQNIAPIMHQRGFAKTRPAPSYAHVKLQLDAQGKKLSKQNHAPALDARHASLNLCNALRGLEIFVPAILEHAPVAEVLEYGIAHWPHRAMFKPA